MTAFVDALTDALPDTLSAPICILGAGAAGITLARELAAKKRHVLLIEAGTRELEGKTQQLYVADNIGFPYYDLASCRLRYFGGTTNHWGGYCRANDAIDYEGRADLGIPGWPINHDDLAPYIERAAGVLGIDSDFFEPAVQLKARGIDQAQLMERRSQLLETKIFQIAQNRRFSERFRGEVAANPYIRTVEHLNAVELVMDAAGNRIDHVRARTRAGKEVTLRADRFILCCHAIENARLLLASNARMPDGIGNHAGHVGKYFMEHAHIFASRFVPSPDFPSIYNRDYLARFHLNANLSLTAEAMRRHGILNYYCRFNPVYSEASVLRARKRIRRSFWQPASPDLFSDVRTVLGDLGSAFAEPARESAKRGDTPRYFELEHRIEQTPNPRSRVLLTNEPDALGLRRVQLDWQFTDLDLKTFNEGQKIIARELSALNMGRFELEPIDYAALRDRGYGHYHHIGTTRMSAAPADGVVDPNLKVHGVANLYVGGSSVFPTAGYSGPTMMLVGMAIRLADHLVRA